MHSEIDRYQQFIDELLDKTQKSSLAAKVQRVGTGAPIEWRPSQSLLALLRQLSPEQMRLLANALQESHFLGALAVLSAIDNQIVENDLRICFSNHTLPVKPFGFGIADDWERRGSGVAWPEQE